MKDKVKYLHHREYVHMKCCFNDLIDVNLRVDYLDYLTLMKKHPMSHELSIFQKIDFFFHHINFFIFVVDLEILRDTFNSMYTTYSKLVELHADEELLGDYQIILASLQKSLVKFGHLDY